MPAVPLVVTMSMTVSTALTPLIVTGIVTVPASSFTDTSAMVSVGVGSLSIIVTKPWKSLFKTSIIPLTKVPSTVKVSFGSSIVSSVIGINTVVEVCPARIVICIVTDV